MDMIALKNWRDIGDLDMIHLLNYSIYFLEIQKGRNRLMLVEIECNCIYSLNSIADGFTGLSGMMDKTWLICKIACDE